MMILFKSDLKLYYTLYQIMTLIVKMEKLFFFIAVAVMEFYFCVDSRICVFLDYLLFLLYFDSINILCNSVGNFSEILTEQVQNIE